MASDWADLQGQRGVRTTLPWLVLISLSSWADPFFPAASRFAQLMGMEMSWFRDGKLGIYELMTEEAGVNFWEVRTLADHPSSSLVDH